MDDTGMEIMEIILLIAGGLIFVLSFFIPEGKNAAAGKDVLSEDEINKLLAQELTALRGRIDEMLQEAAEDVMEKSERSLEKLSNEKIMAVSEYSDTVLSEIHKNHEEAVFLYDMLNNKHTSLKNALSEINCAIKDVEEAKAVLQNTVKEEAGAQSGRQMPGEPGATDAYQEQFIPLGGDEVWPDAFGGTGVVRDVKEEEKGSQNAKILELYGQGKTIVDIAKELNRGVGEVKLIVELHRSQARDKS